MESNCEQVQFHNTSVCDSEICRDILIPTETVFTEGDIIIKKLPYKESRYEHKFFVSSAYYEYIIGRKGSVLIKLSKETKTLIRIPLTDIELVLILGDSIQDIICARQQMDKLLADSKGKLKFTHFISIPMNTADIKDNFNKFKDSCLNECNAPGLKEGMFIAAETLHLTITMILAIEDKDQEKALEAFNTCVKDIISSIIRETGPIIVELKGIKCMTSNPAKARVLYVEVHEGSGYLQEITERIFDYILQNGLTRRERNKINLHMTVINTQKLKDQEGKVINATFDATNILHTYGDNFFGKMKLSTFHLSEMCSRDENGYYKAAATIDVNQL